MPSQSNPFPPDPGATAPAAPPEPPPGAPDGGMVGRYRLLEALGEGGWGSVYLAEQTEPVRRRVALKVIKLGMDTRSVLARFEGERQALALMDHPNIARVLDGGATASGRPYFAMELVRGLRITDYCARHRLGVRERLELFRQVCAAVQHAHQKGIIHRDLKPSNILVAGEGSEAAVKVIDFGIAKSMHGRLADATIHTGLDQAIGTPAYMSPEQLESGGLDLDTRTDIYSLGVVLHELLAGRPPFDPAELERAGPDGLRRIILDREPPPLARAAVPGGVPAEELRGELEWITIKAMEKGRDRRYESAAALSDDIGRFLANEPVLARWPSRTYVIRKFVARHRVGVGAAAAILVSLVGGISVSVWQAREARLAERRTRAAQQRSEDLLDFMTGGLRDTLAKDQSLGVLADLGKKASSYFDSLESGQLPDSTLLRHARIQRQLGEVYLKSGRHGEVRKLLEDSIGRAETVLRRRPDFPEALFELGLAESFLAQSYRRTGETKQAAEWLERYRRTGRRQWEVEPKSEQAFLEMISGEQNLAVFKRDGGDLRGARDDFAAQRATLRTREVTSGDPRKIRDSLLQLESWLGEIAEELGDLRGALEHFAAVTEGLERLGSPQEVNVGQQYRLARNLARQGALWAVTGEPGRARAAVERGLGLMKPLVALDPANQEYRRTTFRLQRHRSGLDPAAAADVDPQLESALKAAPDDTLAVILSAVRRFRAEAARASDPARAEQWITSAVSLAESQLGGSAKIDARREAAQARATAAFLARARGDAAGARAHAESALAHARIGSAPPDQRHWMLLEAEMRARIVLGDSAEAGKLQELLAGRGFQAPVSP